MKKILISIILALFAFSAVPAFAASAPLTPQEKQTKRQLSSLKRRQAVVKWRINRNISRAKIRIRQVQRERKMVKTKRAAARNTR